MGSGSYFDYLLCYGPRVAPTNPCILGPISARSIFSDSLIYEIVQLKQLCSNLQFMNVFMVTQSCMKARNGNNICTIIVQYNYKWRQREWDHLGTEMTESVQAPVTVYKTCTNSISNIFFYI